MQQLSQSMRSGRTGQPRQAGSSDPLATDAAQALQRARQQLESLMRNAQGTRPNPAAQRQLLREALRNVQSGPGVAGRGAPPSELAAAAQKTLEDEALPIDFDLMRRLLAQLDRVQIERVAEPSAPAEAPRVTHLDPQDYPLGYRDWIQRYFRRLAEQP
jgi:hypothetical protein